MKLTRILSILLLAFNSLAGGLFDPNLILTIPTSSAAWTPTTPAGLVLWYKADAITNTVNGSLVTRWVSSDASATVASGSDPCTYTNSPTQNGLPYLTGSAASTRAMAFAPPVGITNLTTFMVYQIKDSGSARTFIYHHGTATGFMLVHDGARTPHLTVWDFTGMEICNKTVASAFANATWNIVAWTWDGSTSTCLTNGTSATIGNGDSGFPAFNNSGFVPYVVDVSVGEILVYNTVLSAGDITSANSYLKARWGTP